MMIIIINIWLAAEPPHKGFMNPRHTAQTAPFRTAALADCDVTAFNGGIVR